MMSGIRGKDTRPEMMVRKYLHRQGFRYRLHDRNLPGTPDLVLPVHRAVVFIHGCFWHRHFGCKYATTPSSNAEFWQRKFNANVLRDQMVVNKLRDGGWRVILIWECGLRRGLTEVELAWLPDVIFHGQDDLVEWPNLQDEQIET